MIPDDGSLNLASLPPDIIRRIIKIEAVSTDNMRLISKSWKTLVDEYHSARENLPALNFCRIYHSRFRKKKFYVSLTIRSRDVEKYAHWMGVWREKPNLQQGCITIRRSWKIGGKGVEGEAEAVAAEIALQLSQILMQFSRVVQLQLEYLSDRVLRIVDKALTKHIQVEDFCVLVNDFDHNLRENTLKLARKHRITRKLSVYALHYRSDSESTRAFLLKIAKCVPHLLLVEGEPRTPKRPGDLFRVSTDFWEEMAAEMVENGIGQVHFQRGEDIVATGQSHLVKIMRNLEL